MKQISTLLYILLFFLFIPATYAQDWLYLNSGSEYVGLGDLDVPGNQITVEAEIYMEPGGTNYDIVSKHNDGSNINYLLRPRRGEISTVGGTWHHTPVNCIPDFNECYHIAMVYDGAMLSHYINGDLNSQTPVTGNMVQNFFSARVGYIGSPFGSAAEQFYGYINEVRIWNVARSQAQIQANMFAQLPNPTTQTGLLAYYRFNSLTNLQGNATWNGNLSGGATLGATSPGCAVPGVACDPLAIGEQPEEEEDLYAPSPELTISDGILKLVIPDNEEGNLFVRLIDMSGRTVIEQKEWLSKGTTFDWELNHLPSGMYLCDVKMNGRQMLIKKVVAQDH
ncbi:MAG: T9SS C-terminal target domain-containing protein [Bacteroidetes bacterium]|nr:MAG: T9SS C-terminal target domain-containing protein [Bacteroidota bacterium]